MKIQFKHYWLLLTVGLIAFSLLVWFEHKQINNAEYQHQKIYQDAQQILIDKEVSFVKVAGDLIMDSVNLQRNWSSVIDIAKKENIIIHVYHNDTLIVWSGNEINTQPLLNKFKAGVSFFQGVNGNYLAYKNNTGTYTFLLFYNINTNYSFKNQYIHNHFNKELSFVKEGFILTKPVEGFYDVKDLTGNYLFSIQIFSSPENLSNLIAIAILFLILYNALVIHIITRHYIQHHLWITTLLFFGSFVVIRWINIYEQIPSFLYTQKLFDPSVYASSLWFPSLGDLLFDSIIFLWYFILLENRTGKEKSADYDGKWFWLKYVLQLSLCLLSSGLAFTFIKSLTIDSQISFDINHVSSINLFTYIGISITIIQLLSVYFISRNLVRIIHRNASRSFVHIIGVGLVCAGAYLFIVFQFTRMNAFQLIMTISILTAFFLFKLFIPKINRFQQYFVVVFIISIFSSATITHWLTIKEKENRKLFAGKLITQNDITTDYFLRNTERKLAEDRNVPDYFLNPIIIKSQFEKRIRQLYFTGYLSKFEVSIFDYDTLGYHFKQRNSYSYSQINRIYENQSLETIDTYFRYLKSNAEIKGYLAKFIVRKNGNRLGYLFLLLQPKLIQDENRFDELLIEGFRENKKKLFDYSYGVYKDKHLIFQSGDYPYRITNTWGEAKDTFRFFTENNFDHVLYTDSQPLTIAVSKPSDSIMQGIALFSFIFTFCTLILIFILFLYIGINAQLWHRYAFLDNVLIRRLRTVFNRFLLIDNPDILYIRTRIQTSIIFIVFITLAFTSYFTISFITQKYNNRQTERLMKKLRNVVITIENENITEMKGSTGELDAFINQMADLYDTDVTLYGPDGKVMASSIGKIYEEGIVSRLMNPIAFFHLNLLKESQYSQDEEIASLDFQAAYAPVFKNKSEVLGYLQLPYFSQKADLLAEISSVVVGFINLYVLLFIIIGVIAYLVSRNISYPLMLIQQKLSRTVLGSKNEPINWQRDDEIGELVRQYNSMIVQLEESAHKLAETEREGAWREIARQIAHEIKNPLTPMKLSIQHLQRAFRNNDSNLEDKINRTTNLLINQIDTLSELATEFSSFAKMPAPNYEHFNVCNALSQVVELYKTNTDTEITFTCDPETEINFDRSYLTRSVGNILKNAIQAIPEGKRGHIDIRVSQDNEIITISVKDNGSGMTPEHAEKIFMPYFSSKISGMGLGLPIVKNMIESGGGRISFSTAIDKGTEFIITLPKTNT